MQIDSNNGFPDECGVVSRERLYKAEATWLWEPNDLYVATCVLASWNLAEGSLREAWKRGKKEYYQQMVLLEKERILLDIFGKVEFES